MDPLAINDTERRVLDAAFDGDFSWFSVLRDQINNLKVLDRHADNRVYAVTFQHLPSGQKKVEGKAANSDISDIVIKIQESDCPLYAWVTVLDGEVRRLQIAGDFNFENPFSLKEVFWIDSPVSDLTEESKIIKSQDRKLRQSVTYHPMYK